MLGGMQDYRAARTAADRSCRARAWRARDRHALGRRQRDPHQLGRHRARRTEAGAGARDDSGMKPGDRVATLAMNHSASSGRLVRRDRHGRGDPHDQPAAVRRATRLYRQPCRGPRAALRQGLPADRRAAEAAMDDDRALYLLRRPRRRRFRGADRRRGRRLRLGGGPTSASPCMLCYTSGTTGNPKGVLYEHRSTVIHAMTEVAACVFDLSRRSGRRCRSCRCSMPPPGACPSPAATVGRKFVYSAVNDAQVSVPT